MEKSHMITLIDTKKAFNKIEYLFLVLKKGMKCLK